MTERDGYFIVSGVCLGLGLISIIFHMIPTARKLQGTSRAFAVRHASTDWVFRSAAYEQVEGVFIVYGCYNRIEELVYRISYAG